MRVSNQFGLPTPVPFVNVHLERDNRLFLDPSAIRNALDPRSRRAHRLLVDFFTEVLRLRASAIPADHTKGQLLLNGLHEPNQTRLGMSKVGVSGTAFGPGLADDVWDVLGANPAARAAVLTRLEHLPIFISKVGPDLISDLTTRILFEVLAEFTSEMVVRYPSIGARQATESIPIYDPSSHKWAPRSLTLPFVPPHQLLLVPTEWVYWRLLMEPEPFYNRFATETVKAERSVRDQRGRLRGPSKKALQVEFKDHRNLNVRQAVKYKDAENRNLVTEYQEFVDRNFDALADEEIDQRTKRPPV